MFEPIALREDLLQRHDFTPSARTKLQLHAAGRSSQMASAERNCRELDDEEFRSGVVLRRRGLCTIPHTYGDGRLSGGLAGYRMGRNRPGDGSATRDDGMKHET
jgi:hypothetical protein